MKYDLSFYFGQNLLTAGFFFGGCLGPLLYSENQAIFSLHDTHTHTDRPCAEEAVQVLA